MQRSSLWTLGLGIVAALWSTQCNSLADDCTKTLTCGDAGAPRLNPRDCKWYFPDGGEWEDGPKRNTMTNRWEWPNGALAPAFECRALGAGGSGGESDNCGVPPLQPGQILCPSGLQCDADTGNCVQCLDNSQCTSAGDAGAGAGRVCNLEIHRCIECNNDRDCAGTGEPFCKQSENAAQNACVQCLSNAHCTSPEVCDDLTGDCTLRCTTSADCRGAKPVCSIPQGETEGVCVECLDNSTCSGGTPECNTTTKQCVQCQTNAPCAATGRVCDTESSQCVRCTGNEHCEEDDATPRCDVADHQCVECVEHSDCKDVAESRCISGTNECAPCTQDNQCEENAPLCRDDGRCVVCRGNDDCPGINNRCDMGSGTCVGCLTDADCPLPGAARCELTPGPTQFTCVPCTSADGHTECAGKSEGGLCSVGGQCVNCLTNVECRDDGPGLSQCSSAGTCVACSNDDDCDLFTDPSLRACRISDINPGCVECVNNNHCVGNPDGPLCKTTTGNGSAAINTCVECITNADCEDPAESKCVNNTCQACGVGATSTATANAACSHLDDLGVCDRSQGNGVCVECTGLQRQACGANVCNSLTKTCTNNGVGTAGLCAPCVSDAHCAAAARCVEESFAGVGAGQYFCVPVQANGICPRGFAQPAAGRATIDQTASICLTQTTCAAYADYLSAQSCANAMDSAACGIAGVADGVCVTSTTGFVCSIPCDGGTDCLDGALCDPTGSFCQP